MRGRIHSFQSLGTVDGPGVRCVIFTQGCPLRCICCHNPDTWAFDGGELTDTDALAEKVLRYRAYFGNSGGVTVSGGEPLMQAAFVAELFEKLHTLGIHTALDTSGCLMNEDVLKLLDVTDLVLLDHKYASEKAYFTYTGCRLEQAESFLDELERRNKATWLRRVIIPGKTDDADSVKKLGEVAATHACVSRVELLPFRNLCAEKYATLGIPFPLEGTRTPTEVEMEKLYQVIPPRYRPQ